MKTWTYTKKIIMDDKTLECRSAHELHNEVYQDWYFDQVDNGLADDTIGFLPYEWVSETVVEVLVTDQAQADSFLAMSNALGDKIGYPISSIVVDYTE